MRHLIVGILIGLLAESGCSAPGLIVRTERGQAESRLQLRFSSWTMPGDPLQRVLVEGYLDLCKQRGQVGDCWGVLDGKPPGGKGSQL